MCAVPASVPLPDIESIVRYPPVPACTSFCERYSRRAWKGWMPRGESFGV